MLQHAIHEDILPPSFMLKRSENTVILSKPQTKFTMEFWLSGLLEKSYLVILGENRLK